MKRSFLRQDHSNAPQPSFAHPFLVGRCTLPRATNRRCRFAGEHLLDVGFDDIGFRYVHNISHVRLKDQPESAFNSIVQGKRERRHMYPKLVG